MSKSEIRLFLFRFLGIFAIAIIIGALFFRYILNVRGIMGALLFSVVFAVLDNFTDKRKVKGKDLKKQEEKVIINQSVKFEDIELKLIDAKITNSQLIHISYEVNFNKNYELKNHPVILKPEVLVNGNPVKFTYGIGKNKENDNKYYGLMEMYFSKKLPHQFQMEVIATTILNQKGNWKLKFLKK